ncbi:Alpha/Beta hydrolase protein [Trametes polyzona]|nr:Alpha/Beta hydrolase protein [Trametes polyzona]
MYLRKDDEISKAAQAAREGDHDRALSHLEASEALIHVVAKALDCTFVQLCDFAQKSPDAKAGSSGAYCGLFVSNDHTKPFAGIAFKGSNSDADIATDEDWQPITPLLPDIAWGAKIHEGFYYNLFGDFTANNEVQTPFGVLLKQLSSAYDGQAKLHITGHSLGGGLCTLAYGEFLRRDAEPAFSSFKFGDVYSFAAPRTCFEPFAQEFNARTRAGGGRYSFRIVNKLDPVPTMPPPGPPLDIFFPTANFPFIHVAGGWEITEDRPPQKMADEPPPVAPMSVDDALNKYAFHHDPRKYYESWQNTPHS